MERHPKNPHIYLLSDGSVAKYSSVGGYPLYYVAENMETFCARCVQEELEDCLPGGDHEIIASDCNWESPELYCGCGLRIESAYAEKEEDCDD